MSSRAQRRSGPRPLPRVLRWRVRVRRDAQREPRVCSPPRSIWMGGRCLRARDRPGTPRPARHRGQVRRVPCSVAIQPTRIRSKASGGITFHVYGRLLGAVIVGNCSKRSVVPQTASPWASVAAARGSVLFRTGSARLSAGSMRSRGLRLSSRSKLEARCPNPHQMARALTVLRDGTPAVSVIRAVGGSGPRRTVAGRRLRRRSRVCGHPGLGS